MSWFRQKDKYWYFCYRENDKEIQRYIGDDKAVQERLKPQTGETKLLVFCPHCKKGKGERLSMIVKCDIFIKSFWEIVCPKCGQVLLAGSNRDRKLLPKKNR